MEDISLSCNFFLIKVSTSYFLLSKTLYCKQWSMETVIIPQSFEEHNSERSLKRTLKNITLKTSYFEFVYIRLKARQQVFMYNFW